jgi:hypothetical protein
MHLCMQDDQINQKHMDRLPHLKKKVFSSKQPSLSAGITPKSSLPCLERVDRPFFIIVLSPSRPKISMVMDVIRTTYVMIFFLRGSVILFP